MLRFAAATGRSGDFGQDPNEVKLRPCVIERYEQ